MLTTSKARCTAKPHPFDAVRPYKALPMIVIS